MIDGEGLSCVNTSRTSFEKEYTKTLETSPSHFLPKFLAVHKRAYIFNSRVADILQELIYMTTTKNAAKELSEQPMIELLELVNTYRRAENLAPATEKTYKSKKALVEAIQKYEAEVKAPTPEQVTNQKSKRAIAEKRLAGLADLKEQKAEEATQRREKKAATKDAKVKDAAKPSKKKSDDPETSGAPKKKGATKERSAAGTGKGKGIGAFCCEQLIKGVKPEEIVEQAQKQFGSKTSLSSIKWYQNKLRKEGRLK